MELSNDKYVVFKREDVSMAQIDTSLILEDAVVIRPRDIFAGPGLSAYAMAIQTAIDLLDVEAGIPRDDGMEWDSWYGIKRADLEALRDFFMEQSLAAMGANDKHLPD